MVVKNDAVTVADVRRISPSHIVISPGPGKPGVKRDFGVCMDVIKEMGADTPLLGVCLGHQGIVEAFGGTIVKADQVMHGKKSMVVHGGNSLFAGVESPFEVMRYHSLVAEVESLPDELEVLARVKGEETIMAVGHREFPIFGIQFHPESIGTPEGKRILGNFIKTS